MRHNQARWRQLHRMTAPIMVLPLLLTLFTGLLFQMALLHKEGLRKGET